MTDILAFCPTYSPDQEASGLSRPYTRLSNTDIAKRLTRQHRSKPGVYFDCIDSVLNNPTPVRLVVSDGRSTESIREALKGHNKEARLEHLESAWEGYANIPSSYALELYPEKMSQWVIFNNVLAAYAAKETEYMVYTSSDVIWHHDWIAEAVKEFERDPKVQILFPCVSRGDGNLPCQIAKRERDLDAFEPPFQRAARAPVLNMYAAIFRMSLLRTYGGYMDAYANCFSESFLHYQCEAIGGTMKVMPRGHVFHHSAVDAWCGEGGWYGYHGEKDKFEAMMDRVLEARVNGKMSVEFLKSELYRVPRAPAVPIADARAVDSLLAASGIML